MEPRTGPAAEPPAAQSNPPAPQPQSQSQSQAEEDDKRLDEELDETFPASDPIPYRHDP